MLLYSQVNPVDSLHLKDSTTIQIDTSKQFQSDIDAIIFYNSADSAVFNLVEKKIYLYNKSQLIYKELKLNSGIIIVDQETQTLEANGIQDTTADKKIVQTPLMYQGSDKYEGSSITYNFKTQQGNISMAYSDADVGYYYGEKVKRVTPKVYFIENGLYTTSTDKVDPEYYFFSPKMKIIPKDKVIAQSVFLYIEGVPVFWIPFVVLPNKSGRTSGIIAPTYGTDATYGIYFSKFGYFWATNDYMDISATASWFSKGRIDFNTKLRYALKYNFTGEFEGGYSRIRLGENSDLDKYSSDAWVLNLRHNQKLTPSSSIDGNLSFVSGKSYYDNSTNNLNQLLRQNVISNLTYSKTWEGTPLSFSMNYYRDQNLQTGDIYERMPSISFSKSESYPFKSDYSNAGEGPLYEYISYSYSGNFRYDRIKQKFVLSNGLDSISRDNKIGAIHNLNLNFTPVMKNFNIRPYFNYVEIWYDKYITKNYNISDSTLSVNEVKRFKAVRYFQTGVSLNTKFVGVVNPKIFNVTGIRHTITPSVTYIYSPDFSTEKFSYYGSYTDATGRVNKYSFFERNIFGGAPMGEMQALNFNVSNLFEMKVKQNDTTENKFQLFNINAGVAYNFAADSLKLSELRTDFRTNIGSLLNIGGGASFNFYKFDNSANTRINKFLLSSDGKFADLTSFNINLSTGYSFTISNFERNPQDTSKTKMKSQLDSNKVMYSMPFSGSISYNYSESRPTPSNIFRYSNISGNIAFSPTDKWKFTFSASYDLVNKQVAAPYFTAYRDLKSWEINFNWYPTGIYRGFKLEIKIKAPELQDIKVTKQTSNLGNYGTF